MTEPTPETGARAALVRAAWWPEEVSRLASVEGAVCPASDERTLRTSRAAETVRRAAGDVREVPIPDSGHHAPRKSGPQHRYEKPKLSCRLTGRGGPGVRLENRDKEQRGKEA